MSTYSEIKDVLKLKLKHVTSCSNAKCNYNVTTLEKSCLLILHIKSTLERTINDNCNVYKGIVLKKKTVIESTLSVLVIQLNLYTSVNGASKKIIDNRINVPTSTVTINKKNDLQVIKKKWPKGAQEAYMLFLEQIM
ncbi:hypothetical protein ALC57_04034 [Trachymyrmex cornetzi]|uniref:Uncharacterized protein n=1 Tax=Trachymyrmex cornetzi TaxID=471704 RepID=A0A151JF69_9HYME|nr:hypothetical protein ALC57_04034 [Trachymyrmex cornetzi]